MKSYIPSLAGFRLVCVSASLVLLQIGVATAAPAGGDESPAAEGSYGFQPQTLQGIGRGANPLPRIWRPYLQQSLPQPVLENSPNLRSLIQDGKMELSLADALALTLENNLDIIVQRYIVPFAETDILRSKSGQAVRSFTGALYPSELNAGAIGAGVTSTNSTGGTGNAGGITGGGGAVTIGPSGAFDPTVNYSFSWDRVTSPLNSVVVSGIPTTTSYATANSVSYAQLFTEGTSYSINLSTLRQSTTQQNTIFNPDVTSRLSIGVNQPLLAGFGFLPNKRFIMVARTNEGTAQEVFRQQVMASVAQLEDAYFGLVAFQENVRVAEKSLAAVRELYDQTRKQQEIGTLSNLDVVTVQSQVAASERDLIVAQTNLEQQETNLKQLISKVDDSALDSAKIVLTDSMPEPREVDLPDLSTALATALANRPELKEAQNNLLNQGVAIKYAQNNQLPTVSPFGLYAASGLRGNTLGQTSGAIGSLTQTFTAAYPETAYGVSFSAILRNRSAQADSIRSQLERNQIEINQQSIQNLVKLQVEQSRIGLIQGKAQVEAAHQAAHLAQLSLDAEQIKLRNGLSTSYNVVLKERDLVNAQYAEVQAVGGYANALVAMDQATGRTMERNGIELGEALTGAVTSKPVPPFGPPAQSLQKLSQ